MPTPADHLLADLTRLGIKVVVHGDRLRYRPRSALTPDLAARLRTHKANLLAILRLFVGPDAATAASVGPVADEPDPEAIQWEDCIDPPPPCPGCGGLIFWWNPSGGRRCKACDPPTAAIRLLEKAERIRRRHGSPSTPGAAEMLGDLKRLIDTCI